MEIEESMLVLVTSGLSQRALAIASKRDEEIYQVDILAPEDMRGLATFLATSSLMPIAQGIKAKDVSKKIAPVLLHLAEKAYELGLLLGTVDKVAGNILHAQSHRRF